jgi:hypothetical protein
MISYHAAKGIDIFLGFRVAEGPFGPAIGQAIPNARRDVPPFVAAA